MAASTISHNTPSPGSISWTAFNIAYGGKGYAVPAGNTAGRFVWWEYRNGTPAVMTGDVLPNLTADDTVLFLNKGGIGQLLPETSVVDGSLIVEESILASAIGADQINGSHIQADAVDTKHLAAGAVTAEQLSVGSVSDNLVANGSFEDYDDGGTIIGWETSSVVGGTIQPVSGVASSGSVAIQFAPSATTANLRLRQAPGQFIPVSAASGRSWYISARMGVSGTATTKGATLRANWYDANRVFLSSTDAVADTGLGTTFAVYEGQVTPPAQARFMGIEIIYNNPNVVSNAYVDEVTSYEVLVSARIGNGQISTPHLKADAIDGMVVTGATIQTAKTGARIVLDQTGLKGWDANNINYLKADASGLTVTGTLTANGTGYDYERLNNVGYPTAIPMDMVVGGAAGGVGLIGTEQWPPPSPAKQGSPIPGLAIKPTGVDMYAYAQVVSRDGLEMQLSSGIKQSTVKIENGTESAYPNYLTVSPQITSSSKPFRAPKYYVNGMDLSQGEVQLWEASGSMPNATVPVPRLGTMTWNPARGSSSALANPDNADPGTLTIANDGYFDISFSYSQTGGTTGARSFIGFGVSGYSGPLARAGLVQGEDTAVAVATGVKLTKGQKIVFEVYQSSGGAKNYQANVIISRVAAPSPSPAWEQGNKSVSGNLSVSGLVTVGNETLFRTKHAEFTTTNWAVAGNGASWDTGWATLDAAKSVNPSFCRAGGAPGAIDFLEDGYYSISCFIIPRGNPGLGWSRLNHSDGTNLVQMANDSHMWETMLTIPAVFMAAGTWVRSQMSYALDHSIDVRWRIHKLPY